MKPIIDSLDQIEGGTQITVHRSRWDSGDLVVSTGAFGHITPMENGPLGSIVVLYERNCEGFFCFAGVGEGIRTVLVGDQVVYDNPNVPVPWAERPLELEELDERRIALGIYRPRDKEGELSRSGKER
ncbi:MAG: hypothetical protein ACMG6E_05960 [Candidatus Roizmanbacteria bacterium]